MNFNSSPIAILTMATLEAPKVTDITVSNTILNLMQKLENKCSLNKKLANSTTRGIMNLNFVKIVKTEKRVIAKVIKDIETEVEKRDIWCVLKEMIEKEKIVVVDKDCNAFYMNEDNGLSLTLSSPKVCDFQLYNDILFEMLKMESSSTLNKKLEDGKTREAIGINLIKIVHKPARESKVINEIYGKLREEVVSVSDLFGNYIERGELLLVDIDNGDIDNKNGNKSKNKTKDNKESKKDSISSFVHKKKPLKKRVPRNEEEESGLFDMLKIDIDKEKRSGNDYSHQFNSHNSTSHKHNTDSNNVNTDFNNSNNKHSDHGNRERHNSNSYNPHNYFNDEQQTNDNNNNNNNGMFVKGLYLPDGTFAPDFE